MIRVSCAECGEAFEIGEEFAGLAEFCPACGALNDIPPLQEEEEPEPVAQEAPSFQESPIPATDGPPSPGALPNPVAPPRPRGVPSPLWWALIVGGIASFIVACVLLFSDNWESRNLNALNDADNRGDVLIVDGDYSGAAAQYRFVLDTVGSRQIESTYIRQLIERARRGAAQAKTMAQAPPHAAVTTAPAVTPPATQPDIYEALKHFQRDSEAFPQFVRDRPVLFLDNHRDWRRRQFVVWDVSYQRQPNSNPQQILLSYSCASHVTEPHGNRRDADNDGNFVNDASPQIVHCRTLFELFAGRWVIVRHDVEAGLAMDDLYALERLAFHTAPIPQ
ncbi:MAG TPA: hypothetical protein VHX86_15555 [Tepidisphaeraceae bacterium]|nr:hypothetical protein [Tepidisphaeraceae bacterium]